MKYLILAGGSGTRLWPLSRKYFAKQFLKLINNKTMLENTALRVSKEEGNDIFIISTEESKNIVFEQLKRNFKNFSEKNFILEPIGRNTCPAISYSCLFFQQDDILVVLSSDHHIKDDKKFNIILEKSCEIAKDGYIVTLGIIPDSPKTGYGYIKKSQTKIKDGFLVEKFVEKPQEEIAKEYLKDGNYYWNAGIFIFRVNTFLNELKKYDPEIYSTLLQIEQKLKNNEIITKEDFMKFKNISIDYSVMEKSDKIVIIPADFGWNDIGSFQSLYEISDKDENNNVIKINNENFINISSKNLFVYGEQRIISTINISDLVIIDTKDALLISDIKKTEKVKDVVEVLKNKNLKEADYTNNIITEWGNYTIIDNSPNYKVLKLQINPEKEIKLHSHKGRNETISVVSGEITIITEKETKKLKVSESMIINPNIKHKLINTGKDNITEIIEIQSGKNLIENDYYS